MKSNGKKLIIALLVGALSWAMPMIAQNVDTGSSNGTNDSGSVSENRLRSDNRLLNRILKNQDRLPEDLQEDVALLQESLQAIRDAWLTGYRPGEGATAEEIKAAREQFQAEYAEEIEANKELRVAVMREVRQGIRDAIDDSEWSEEARALYAEYKLIKTELAEAWQAIRAELGDDATREDIVAAKERFKEENAELIAQQKELATQVRELIRENRGNPGFERDPLPEELQELRREMAQLRHEVRTQNRTARDDMQGMTREQREQYRQTLLNEMKDLHDEIKERRRQIIGETRDGQNGDNRPEG
ncbi:hypothetical protein VDG1235_3733 [Verrucomicrobiia bacterium DG1235]|nr:hypothetical protein VDG1235_3733 [Verrucomicrobiae bacterium DG1235]